MTLSANRTTTRAQRRGYPQSKSSQKASKSMTANISASNDGEPITELATEGFSIAVHNDSEHGLIITLDDLELYALAGLNDEALRCTLTPGTWQRLRALVMSGVVDQVLVVGQ